MCLTSFRAPAPCLSPSPLLFILFISCTWVNCCNPLIWVVQWDVNEAGEKRKKKRRGKTWVGCRSVRNSKASCILQKARSAEGCNTPFKTLMVQIQIAGLGLWVFLLAAGGSPTALSPHTRGTRGLEFVLSHPTCHPRCCSTSLGSP